MFRHDQCLEAGGDKTMKLQEPIRYDDFTSGLIDDISVSDSLFPKNAVRHAVNVIFDRPRGAISQRYGTTLVGTGTIGGAVQGLFNFRSSSASLNQLLTAVGSSIYRYTGVTWSVTTSFVTSTKFRFITYLDRVAVLNGTDTPQSWSGSGAWLTTGGPLDIANFPISKFATILNTRIFAAGNPNNPDTVYGSSLEASSAISWTSGNKSFKVYANDGNGSITSLKGNGKVILIFKERGLYRYDDTELQKVADIGTSSHESVFNDDNGVTYFFGTGVNGVGFYKTTGGYPIKISRPIQKWVEAISPSNYANIAGYTDGRNCYWSIGTVTVNSTTYANSWLVYSISDQTWSTRNYGNRFNVLTQYIDSNGNLTTVGGDTAGNVQTIDSGNTDNGTPIESECEGGAFYLTTRGRVKVINEFVSYAKNYQGLNLMLKADNSPWQQIGTINRPVQYFKNPPKLRGYEFRWKIRVVNSGIPFQFDGFEFQNISDEGYEDMTNNNI